MLPRHLSIRLRIHTHASLNLHRGGQGTPAREINGHEYSSPHAASINQVPGTCVGSLCLFLFSHPSPPSLIPKILASANAWPQIMTSCASGTITSDAGPCVFMAFVCLNPADPQKPANSVMAKRREWNRSDELLHYAAQKVPVVKSLPKYLII